MSSSPFTEEMSMRELSLGEQASRQTFLRTLRELVQTYQVFSNYSAQHVRTLGLTPPQYDVIVTLGCTQRMNMNKLGERTLVTKGTLTGIIDRLEEKGLVKREVPESNRRSFHIVLTPAGQQVFEEVFPSHVEYLRERFGPLNDIELETITHSLRKLREIF